MRRFTVATAPGGGPALQIAAQLPDLVITKFAMPGMDGVQLCQTIREHPQLRDTPVAILTDSKRIGDPRAGAAAVCATLLRYVSNRELIRSVQELITRGPHDHTNPCQ